MSDQGTARAELLRRLSDEVARHGLADRSLREVATAAGSSHRMVIYHFGSRAGLVAAIVEAIEADQRATLRELAATSDGPADLVRALWARVSSPELRPFVRLFFEALAVSGRTGTDALTAPWLDDAVGVAEQLGLDADPVDLRLGIAVTRGLLIDVLASGDVEPATVALERYLQLWDAG